MIYYNIHEVACILAEVLGDTCACNINGNDEWLPEYCDFADKECPNPVGVVCWEQYLCHKDERKTKEIKQMSEQIQFIPCGEEDVDDLKRQALLMEEYARKKKAWEAAFQRWSDKQMFDETTSYGKCGYGAMCDWCNGCDKGRACVRALNAMCREKNVTIDYDDRNFERIWRNGE